MICLPLHKPRLEIPAEVWDHLAGKDFINFSVPLLNPPVEFEGRLFWDGAELMMLSPALGAFARFEDAEAHMPYDEMFRIVESPDASLRAQIYAIFFEKEDDEWFMMYRLMNVSRLVTDKPAPLPGMADDDLPTSSWMLTLDEPTEWLTLNDFIDYYCEMAGYGKLCVDACVKRQLEYTMGSDYNDRVARIKPLTNGMAILVPTTERCAALLLDLRRGERIARFVMDDPQHLVSRFWRMSAKIFVNKADKMELQAIANDAWHYAHAIRSAREQTNVEETLTAAAFYC